MTKLNIENDGKGKHHSFMGELDFEHVVEFGENESDIKEFIAPKILKVINDLNKIYKDITE